MLQSDLRGELSLLCGCPEDFKPIMVGVRLQKAMEQFMILHEYKMRLVLVTG